jgi:hypothetical protein
MSISDYLENALLNYVLTNSTAGFTPITAVYGSLHTGDPGETGTAAPLASCPRMAIVFNAAASATSVNATGVTWTANATGTVSHLGLWDGSSTATANHLWSGALTAPKVVANVGDTVTLASGQLSVSLA